MSNQNPSGVFNSFRANSAEHIRPAQFLDLLLSCLHLVRADRRHLGLRGVKDLNTGEVFEIEERKLFVFQQRSAPQ